MHGDIEVKTRNLGRTWSYSDRFKAWKNSNVSFVFSDASSEQIVDIDRCPGHSPQVNIDGSSSIIMRLVESDWTELLIRSEQPGSGALVKE